MVRRVSFRLLALLALIGATSLSGLPMDSFEPARAEEAGKLGVRAAEAAFRGRYAEAGALAGEAGDPAVQKLVELLYLRDSWKDAGYPRIVAFLAAAPNWPYAETLMKRAEQALYHNHADAPTVLAHFADRLPRTPEGALALARARLGTGDKEAARKLIAKVWADEVLDASLERAVADEFGGLLTADDTKRRVSNLIFAQETNAAVRASKNLSKDYQAAAKAAQALIRSGSGADRAYGALAASMRQLPAVQYALARYYRKREADGKARAILTQVPGEQPSPAAAEAWWIEKRILARKSIGPGRQGLWRTAYQLARSHGYADGPSMAEGEFLAGWIALRSLKEPRTALKHFGRLAAEADSRTERARGAYWLGRAYSALGDQVKADAAYAQAATTPTVYYGQLARERLGLARRPIAINPGQPSPAARTRMANDEVMRAFRIVAATGRRNELNSFLWAISGRFKTLDDMNAAAAIAAGLGGPPLAVRLAKLAGQKGLDIDAWAYPTKALPDWASIGKPVEKPLVFGLTRQESEFDPGAGSSAGAKGLMQLMPATARLVARQYGLAYAPSKLTADPAFNVKLGAAHLADLIADFNGSYVLTLAAYNAGPRRAREWVEAYGDPRSGEADPIDWVESIPFTETRNYVQKVLQNTQIYRSRLSPETMTPLSADLKRGQPADIAVASTSAPKLPGCSRKAASIAEVITDCD